MEVSFLSWPCSFVVIHMQPGYLRDLLPDSAPNQPDSFQHVLDGEVAQLVLEFT